VNGILLASLLSVVAVEYFFHIPIFSQAHALLKVTQKSARVVFSSRISDHWKEVVLFRYAQELLRATTFVGLMLIGAMALIVTGAIFLDWWIEPIPTTMNALSMFWGWIGMIIASMGYFYLRNRFVGN
jgi:hypothetical protein